MNEFRGIVLYTIERDNNLNGVYTNNHIPNARIFTETARRSNPVPDLIEQDNFRVYDCFYFDVNRIQQNCQLTFRIENTNIYNAEWRINDEVIFIGQGFQMNDRQIAISYWVNPDNQN